MKIQKNNHKLLLLIYIITAVGSIVYAQTTTVTPVLTLNASGIVDQDDMCIWIHPADKSQSTVITSDKTASKLFVYDLSGNTLQTINVPGKPGNIDVRYNFEMSGQPTDIVGYNDRDNGTIVFYKVDPVTRQLSYVSNFGDGGMTGDNYGFCLYRSPNTGKYYSIASSNSTQMKQWELMDNGNGTIGGILKRTWNNGNGDITEGLVADDETGQLYCANEGEGIYKYDADPLVSNPTGVLVAGTGQNGLTQDVEGITIYYAANGEGYLMASSQGNSTFKVYERKEPHNFVKTIDVVNAGSTDGIDVTNVNLGSGFPEGIFVVHNGSGSSPYEIRVCKYEDLGLTTDTSYWNPRDVHSIPVELNSFDGKINDNKIELTWQTATETNNLGFDIEKGYDNYNYKKVGFVSGHGTTTEKHFYKFLDEYTTNGKVFYRLKQIDLDGSFSYSDNIEIDINIPIEFNLFQNYPNPFNPSTKISWQTPVSGRQTLKIYDVLGNELATLVDEYRPAGNYEVGFNSNFSESRILTSGIYFYQLKSGSFIKTKKMTITK